MDRARIHEGIRRMRFTDLLGRTERSELSQMEAAEILGVSERTFRRWRDRHREADSSAIVLTQSALKLMGFKNPIGQHIRNLKKDWHVVGVVRDFVTGTPFYPMPRI